MNDCVQVYAYAEDPMQYERIIIFRLRQLGVANMKTEEEKIIDTARVSAAAAELSAKSARWSAVVAVLAFFVSVAVTLFNLW